MMDYSQPFLEAFKLLRAAERLASQRLHEAAIHKLSGVRAQVRLAEFALKDAQDAAAKEVAVK